MTAQEAGAPTAWGAAAPPRRLAAWPAVASEIDARWMTEALGAQAAATGPVSAVSVEPVGDGRGHLGSTVRVRLRYAARSPDAPAAVVVKLPGTAAESRETARRGRLYEREYRFFTELAPQTQVSTPRCFAAGYDPDTDRFALVLEDVTARLDLDQLHGCPPDRAAAVLSELAGLHAAWWRDPSLHRRQWLTTFTSAHRLANLRRLLADGWPRLIAEVGDRLPPGAARAGRGVLARFDRSLHALDRQPHTLIHGDVRLDNLLFDAGEDRVPVAIVDWQNVSRGPGVADVSYFLVQSLTAADFRDEADGLLAYYHRSLRGHGVRDYPFSQLARSVRLALPVSFAVAASLFVMGDTSPGRTRELAVCMAERSLAALRHPRMHTAA
jgi:aminoglycoside phosphotransferase (APT) family kinase protein